MYEIKMVVNIDGYRARSFGSGPTLDAALERTSQTALGIDYGPDSDLGWDYIYDELEMNSQYISGEVSYFVAYAD